MGFDSQGIWTLRTSLYNFPLYFSWDLCGFLTLVLGFPGGPVVKNLPVNAGDVSLVPGPGRSHMPRGSYPVRSHW